MAWRRPGNKPLSEPIESWLDYRCIFASFGLNESVERPVWLELGLVWRDAGMTWNHWMHSMRQIFCRDIMFRHIHRFKMVKHLQISLNSFWWQNIQQRCFIGCTSLVPHLIGSPSHWSPISLVPHLIDPPISTHAPLISLVPHLIGLPDSLVPHLIGPPIHKSPTTLFELIGPPSH